MTELVTSQWEWFQIVFSIITFKAFNGVTDSVLTRRTQRFGFHLSENFYINLKG
jgi:hypothetical protein